MKDLNILDQFVDDREFRNYIHKVLHEKGFCCIYIDDTRIADENILNDNDMTAQKDGITYSIQTYLNKGISKKEVQETIDDIEKEHAMAGIIVTNTVVSDEIKEYAKEKQIEIWDRQILILMCDN